MLNRFEMFSSGETLLENKPRPERSSDFDDEALKTLVESNPRQGGRKLAKVLNALYYTIYRHPEKIRKEQQAGVYGSTRS